LILLYLIVALRTRTLTKRSESLSEQVKKRTLEVEKLLENKNQELANVSHEFRTPLTLILGPIAKVITSLKSSANKKEIKQLEMTQRNGYRLLRMVDQLLNIESFQVKSILHKQPVAFGDATKLICDPFQAIAKSNQVIFKVLDLANINFEFTADAYEKIVLNLLSNAFKYTLAGGAVSIGTRVTSKQELELTVTDTGIGIPLEAQTSIFKRFSRSTKLASGAGIGLALVKSLVEGHQGRIEIESTPDVGLIFKVYLPIINPVKKEAVKRQADQEFIAMELASLAYQTSHSSTNNNPDGQKKMALIKF